MSETAQYFTISHFNVSVAMLFWAFLSSILNQCQDSQIKSCLHSGAEQTSHNKQLSLMNSRAPAEGNSRTQMVGPVTDGGYLARCNLRHRVITTDNALRVYLVGVFGSLRGLHLRSRCSNRSFTGDVEVMFPRGRRLRKHDFLCAQASCWHMGV